MKKSLSVMLVCLAMASVGFAAEKGMAIGTVSFKTVIEKSRIGKEEQVRFEQMRKQMEQTLEQKEKELNELGPKFNEEYLDSLTPEAEKDLKDKFSNLSQELTQKQNEFYQSLNQAQMQVVQKVYEMVSEASKSLAAEKGLDLIINDEVCFFKNDKMDVSADIIKKLDQMAEKNKNEAEKK
jgi:outer membrane protein